jgi:Topoisomerase DNA binding C4 zinc finger.
MEIIGIIIVIGIVWSVIASIFEKQRQGLRDKVAHEVLDQTFDFEKEKQEILALSSQFAPEEYRCPRCSGILLLRNGIYGKFFGCSHYPDCRFTKKV